MAVGSTQPLTEMSTRNISWGGRSKGGRCVGLTTYHLRVLTVSKSGSLKLLELSGPVIGLYRDCCSFIYIYSFCLLANLSKVTRAMYFLFFLFFCFLLQYRQICFRKMRYVYIQKSFKINIRETHT